MLCLTVMPAFDLDIGDVGDEAGRLTSEFGSNLALFLLLSFVFCLSWLRKNVNESALPGIAVSKVLSEWNEKSGLQVLILS